MSQWKEAVPEQWEESVFKRIGKDWMLVTAEKPDGSVNTMTASWGGLGVMWGKPVAFVVIRPQRYTKEFIDASGRLSLSFYGEEYRKMLSYMGSTSGRDADKIGVQGLTVVHESGIPFFEEADTAMVTRVLFAQPYTPDSFLDAEVREKWYPDQDYHTLYICEIEKLLVKEA